MTTMLFYFDLTGKIKIKKLEKKLRHQVVEAEAIQKLSLPYPCVNAKFKMTLTFRPIAQFA